MLLIHLYIFGVLAAAFWETLLLLLLCLGTAIDIAVAAFGCCHRRCWGYIWTLLSWYSLQITFAWPFSFHFRVRLLNTSLVWTSAGFLEQLSLRIVPAPTPVTYPSGLMYYFNGTSLLLQTSYLSKFINLKLLLILFGNNVGN